MQELKTLIFAIMYNYGGFYANDTRAKLKHLSGGEYGHTETHIKLCGITATAEEYQAWAKSQN